MIKQPNEKMNQMLSDFNLKKITTEEFNLECAHWFMDCFDTVHRKPSPTIPRRYDEYARMTDYEKKDMPKEFWSNSEIKYYLDQKQHIETENASNLHWLKEFKSFLPEQDFLSHSKYQQKINEFTC